MAKKRSAKKTKKKVVKVKRRAASARKRKTAARKPERKTKPKRRPAKTKLPPRAVAQKSPRPMTQPGPAVTPLAARPSPFPSSVPGDFAPDSEDGKN